MRYSASMPWLPLAVLGAVTIFWWFSLQEDLFALSIRGGRVLVVRGRVPARFVADVRDVIGRTRVSYADIRARPTANGGRLAFTGDIDDITQQRLRNVFGLIPAIQLRTAPPIHLPTFGQVVGIVWLAWLFERRAKR